VTKSGGVSRNKEKCMMLCRIDRDTEINRRKEVWACILTYPVASRGYGELYSHQGRDLQRGAK
jgi:hypothetical protein